MRLCFPSIVVGLLIGPASGSVSVGQVAPALRSETAQRAMSPNDPNAAKQRLKIWNVPDRPFNDYERHHELSVWGVWIPDSKDSKPLDLPEQVEIRCKKGYKKGSPEECAGTTVQLSTGAPEAVLVFSLEKTQYEIESWNDAGLVASHMSACRRQTLTIDFGTGLARTSYIPLPGPTCLDPGTRSYRLVRGYYYVDTTPNNDLDKRKSLPQRRPLP